MQSIARFSALLISLLFPLIVDAAIGISGKVQDDQKRSIRGAEVVLLGIQDPVTTNLSEQLGSTYPVPLSRALTNDLGEYHIQGPNIGLWMVQIRAAGFVPVETLLSPLLESEELPTAKMTSDAGLTLHVASQDGKRISGALVIADDSKEPSLWLQDPWLPVRRVGLTSAEGVIRFPAGSKESLIISVTAKGYAFLEKKQVNGPSASFRLTPGVTSNLEVVSEKNKPVAGASIQIGVTNHPLGITGEDGRIEFITDPKEKIAFVVITRDERRYAGEFQSKPDPSKATKVFLKAAPVLSGKIVNRETKAPIAGALIWTTYSRWNIATSKKDGTFLLKASNGSQFLRAAAPGFTIHENDEPQNIDSNKSYTIALEPEAQLSGIVLNTRNEPISGAEIELSSSSSRYWFNFSESKQRKTTNQNGNFRFARLKPESKQKLTVRANGFSRKIVEESLANKTKKEIRIVLTPEISTVGKVVDLEDRPLEGIQVSMQRSVVEMSGSKMINTFYEKSQKIEGQTESNGTFQIGELSAGKYDLEVGGKGFGKLQKIGLEIPESRKPVDLGTIVLNPAMTLEGRVIDSRKQPVEGAQIYVHPHNPWTGYWEDNNPSAVTGVDGFFSIPDQTPGSVIDIYVERTGYVEENIREFPMPPREPLTITLNPASNVSGIVVDSSGQPVNQASLQLLKRVVRATRSQTMYRGSAESKTDGTFQFTGVTPDRYVLTVQAPGWQDYQMEGVEVSQGKDVSDLRITLAPEAFLEGTVLMSDGTPAIGSTIKTAGEELRNQYRPGTSQAFTDGSGSYSLHGLKPGKNNIEATHEEAIRQVKEIELKPGSNQLDFQLENGYSISGRTQDESGAPVSNVTVRTYTMSAGRNSAISGEDGTFKIKSVPNGEHTLQAEREGYGTTSAANKVQVNGAPVEGVTITLRRGGVIKGQVLGLPAEKLSLVYIDAYCQTENAYATTKVDYQGMYYLRGISPGLWEVTAALTAGGGSVSKNITIEPGMTEATLDLEFNKGLTLDGTVVSSDSPVANAYITINGKETQSWANATSGPDGNFHLEGLSKGKHKLSVSNWQEGWQHQEEVDLQSDQKILVQIPSNRISGIVLDAQDRSPLSGVIVSLLAPNANPDVNWAEGSMTDSAGKFLLKNANPGNWLLTAKKEGYASQNQSITIEDKGEISGIELLLQSTGGVTLEVRNALGATLESVSIAVVNSSSQILSVANYVSQGNGKFRISTIPSGTWELILSDWSSAQTSVNVTVPQAEPLKVNLLPQSKLKVKVPDLVSNQAVAKMTLTGSDGKPFRALQSWTGSIRTEFQLYSGETIFDSLPPGTWNITVTAPDGRQWLKSVTTSPNTTTEAILE